MTGLLTAAQMRAIETAAIDSGGVTGLDLMERAGQGVVEAIFEEWPAYRSAPQSAAILCGPGNNGGDGFVVARLLHGRGWTVRVFFYGDPDRLPPDARTNHDIWLADAPVTELSEKAFRDRPFNLYVDALFGTGLTRPLEGPARDVISYMAGRNGDDFSRKTVCIDAPSGLCMDSGRILGENTAGFASGIDRFARLTVVFDSPKVGHFIGHGPDICGKVIVKDIGLGGRGPAVLPGEIVKLVGRAALPRSKYGHGHKYVHGHALILSGGAGKTGAARLAARGALRIGAGLVTLGVPASAQMEAASQVTAVMLRRVSDGAGLADVLADARINALCLGPGLGIARARDLVPAALRAGHMPCVTLDADALTAYEDMPGDLFAMLHENCVLTPHGGEFARLFPDIAAKLSAPAARGPAYSKVDATREAARRAGCVILFKGPDTVIAAPDGRCSINAARYDRAAPWLATAGSGDVLAGFVTGLLARGADPVQAAETAAYCHVECARSFGPGLIAEDLPDILPKVLRDPD